MQLSPSQNKAGGQDPACEQEADEWWPGKITFTEVVSVGFCSKERNTATIHN